MGFYHTMAILVAKRQIPLSLGVAAFGSRAIPNRRKPKVFLRTNSLVIRKPKIPTSVNVSIIRGPLHPTEGFNQIFPASLSASKVEGNIVLSNFMVVLGSH
jgi:hypothetical protein